MIPKSKTIFKAFTGKGILQTQLLIITLGLVKKSRNEEEPH